SRSSSTEPRSIRNSAAPASAPKSANSSEPPDSTTPPCPATRMNSPEDSASALALRPELIVLDEPLSALDVSVAAQIANLLRDLQRDFSLTYLFISHSMPMVRYLSTRIAVLHHGRMVEYGDAEQICSAPREPYTQTLIAATPEIRTA